LRFNEQEKTMREINISEIVATVKALLIEANYHLGQDIVAAFERGIAGDESPVAREVLKELKENARIAAEGEYPLCQDTGLAVLFVDIGQDVHVVGGNIKDAFNEGVRQAYKDGYLRKSSCDPFTRKNTGDNTPAIIHYDIVPGEKIKIMAVPKGGGAENMSRVQMLAPSAGVEGIKDYIVNRIREAGSNPCPPIIVGVGIGGTFERTAILAKKALLRKLGERNPDPGIAALEREVLELINKLGTGPMGYGGTTTALEVFFEVEPCHIASLPLAVNVQCHQNRHKEATI